MAGLIPQPFIDALINCSNIVELIDAHVPLKKQGRVYVACCPFHNEKTPSFNVVSKKQFYHCFGCGASGNVISFVMNYLNVDFIEAIEILAAKAGMEVPRSSEERYQKKESASLYQTLEDVNVFYQQQLKRSQLAIDYLKQRGVSGNIAKRYELGFAPEAWNTLEHRFKQQGKLLIDSGMLIVKDSGHTYDRYRQRIMFPIRDRNGRMIGFGGRAISPDQKPKYLNSPETAIFQKNRELYGLHQIIQASPAPDSIIVVEGYMDVIALAQHGIPQAVAALGTATSSYHIQLLSRHCKRIIFCFDGDEAGRKAAWRALEHALPQMNNAIDTVFAFLPEGHDPDSYVHQFGKEKFFQFIQSSIPLDQFFFQYISKGIDMSSTAGKSQLLSAVLPYLSHLNAGPFKTLLIDMLAKRTRIEGYRIEQMAMNNPLPPSGTAIPAPKGIQRTPLRVAIALLIQQPKLVSGGIDALDLEWFDDEKYRPLIEILHFIKQYPNCTTAHILEHWRASPLHATFHKLAAWNTLIPSESLKAELYDTLQFIKSQAIETRIETCKRLLSDADLSNAERATNRNTLLKLIQLKTGLKTKKDHGSSNNSG